jgi:hypothetical protein
MNWPDDAAPDCPDTIAGAACGTSRPLDERSATAPAARRNGMAVADVDRMHVSAVMARGRLPVRTITSSIHRAAWLDAAPIPRGANHIGVAAQDGVIHAFGGFVEQNSIATRDCYAQVVTADRWHVIGLLSRARVVPFSRWPRGA